MKRLLSWGTVVLFLMALSTAYGQGFIIEEGFDGFDSGVRPDGWEFYGIEDEDVFTLTGFYGAASPALKFADPGDQAISRIFSNPKELYFWLRGTEAETSSFLLVEEFYQTVWYYVAEVYAPDTYGGITAGPLPFYKETTRVRFTYTAGELAFDDVRIRPLPSPTPIPGNIEVEDSIPPIDDRDMPFGQLILGQVRTEQVTVRNTDLTYDLVVSGIGLTGGSFTTSGDARTAAPDPVSRKGLTAFPITTAHRADILLVGFHPEIQTTAREAIHARLGARRVRSFPRIAVDVVELPVKSDLETWIKEYESRPEVAYAEPNYEWHVNAVPNDPRFPELWGLNNTGQTGGTPGADISAVEAWDTTTGSHDVIVAVIDTGIDYNHPDLAANMWINPSPTFGDIYGARWTSGNGIPTSGNPMDGHSHGTHCAGTIGAVGDNGVGVAGVNWSVRLMALKFLSDSGSGATADAVAALEYAIDHGANLTSNSWGGGGYSQALEDMIDAAGAANQLFIAAAGNDATNNDNIPHYPSSYDCDNVIAVASSDHNDLRSSFSCWGPVSVDLAAPGSNILSTVLGSGYGTKSGTSMATPHVSGVAVLILSLNPGASHQDVKGWILDGVDVLPAWAGLTLTGGRLNAAEALILANPHFRLENLPALPAGVAPGGSFTFDVIYEPVSEGSHQNLLRIASNDADEPEVYVELSGSAVEDFIMVAPPEDLDSSGDEGGPFDPASKTYMLTNRGGESLDWTAGATADWLTVAPASGSLAAGASTDVEVSLNANAEALAPGDYADTVTFTNLSSGFALTRGVSLTVIAIPGNIEVEDSIPPTDDRDMPFGELIIGNSRTERITVRNTNPTYDLTVNRVFLAGGYFEDFDDGEAQGWEPKVPAQWLVVAGEYRASDSLFTGWMQSRYAGQTWVDCAYQATFRRTGDLYYTCSLFARATEDFNMNNFVGSAYGVGISEGGGYYWVIRFEDGNETWLTGGWVYSPYLYTDGTPNVVLLNIAGSSLQVYFNGNLAWSGTDDGISDAGYIGLMGYTDSLDTTDHYYDDVQVTEPLTDGAGDLSVAQAWYNAHSFKGEATPERVPADLKPPAYSGEVDLTHSGGIGLLSGNAFRLENLPALPTVVSPDGSFDFDVVYEPVSEGEHENLVRIISNDADEPEVEVTLSGSAVMDVLTVAPDEQFESSGYEGGPFSPLSKTYTLTNTGVVSHNWTGGATVDWLTVAPGSGSLAAGASTDIEVSLNANADSLPGGVYTDVVTFTNTDTGGTRTRGVTLNIEISLCQALDNCDLVWTTGGNAEWFGQTVETHDSQDAAQSGAITHNQNSWLDTAVEGPGELSFWWKVSSESGYDYLEFYINSVRQIRISGSVNWQRKSYPIGEGQTALRWRYMKDGSVNTGSDCGWVDQVVYTPACVPAPGFPEGFDNYDSGVRPSGWEFTGINSGDVYTQIGFYGAAMPSLRFDSAGDRAVSRTFSNPESLYFWLRGTETDTSSFILVEEYYNTVWQYVAEVYAPYTYGGVTAGPLPLYPDTTRVRFTYIAGTVAFDDVNVCLLLVPTPTPTPPTSTRTPPPTRTPTPPPATRTPPPTPTPTPTPPLPTATPTPILPTPVPVTGAIWYLPAGGTSVEGVDFDTYILIANPGDEEANIEITYVGTDQVFGWNNQTVLAGTRYTENMKNFVGPGRENVAAIIRSLNDVPIIVERAMYFPAGSGADGWFGSHNTIGLMEAGNNWFLAEGATHSFDQFIHVLNPGSTAADVNVTFFNKDGDSWSVPKTLGGRRVWRVKAEDVAGSQDQISTCVTSNRPVAVDRTMYWPKGANNWQDGHSTIGVLDLAWDWYLPEGATNIFNQYVLVANPNPAQTADVTFTFSDQEGNSWTHIQSIPAQRRYTVNVNNVVGSVNQVSTRVKSDIPVVAERAMYWPMGSAADWTGGHDTVGASSPQWTWQLPEGATHIFDQYVLVANPGETQAANVTFTFRDNQSVIGTHDAVVEPQRRYTVKVNNVVGSVGQVWTTVEADIPVVAERAMYFPPGSHVEWKSGHVTVGVNSAYRRWRLPKANTQIFNEYVLVANPNLTRAADVTCTFRDQTGTVWIHNAVVQPQQRYTVRINDVVGPVAKIWTMVEADIPVVAERATSLP